MNTPNNIAIIPARGGSKRIPRKNIKYFEGKPIISYSIEVALNSNLFETVMVSTDDEEIAEIARKYGAQVPFLRSAKNSDDFAGTADVLLEVLLSYKNSGKEFKHTCCIYPTAPLITERKITEAYELLNQYNYKSVLPVCAFSYPIQRGLHFTGESKIDWIWPENSLKRSQDLSPSYHDAGQFYWIDTNSFLESKKLLTSETAAIILRETEMQDIDNENDWSIAEMKYKLLKKHQEQ